MRDDVRRHDADLARPGRDPSADASEEVPLILLLQGPVGPFFGHLGRAFERAGCAVLKVNFNGGDWLFHRAGQTVDFVGSTSAWSDWLDGLLRRRRPAAIVLFGDGRPYHVVAIAAAARAGIPVWCLEEGYERPHFVTCEKGGNNARSPLRDGVRADGKRRPAAPYVPVTGDVFAAMAVHAVLHAVANALGAPFFRGNASHRDRPLWSEALLWSRGFLRKVAGHRRNGHLIRTLIGEREGRYVVVALQVHDDLHLLRNGRGWTMDALVSAAIASFARHAEPEMHLVFKVHPMDRGHRSYRSGIRHLAEACGRADRIHVVDDGSIGLMIRHSCGVVTVNSTSGLLALNHGKPLLALGEAVYTGSGLATDAVAGTEELDRFWRSRVQPNRDRVARFLRRMREESQVNGSFYLRAWLDSTSRLIAARVRAEIARPVPLRPARPRRRGRGAAHGLVESEAGPPSRAAPEHLGGSP